MKLIKKIIQYLLVVVIVIVIVDAALVFGIGHWHREVKHADAVIVLGAAINSPALYNRTLTALDLYKQGKVDTLVLSGGRISEADVSEAGYMQKVIKANTDAMPPVIVEDQSNNTYENIKNSRAKLSHAKSVVIVSDRFHLARGVALAVRNGFWPVYWKSPDAKIYRSEELRFYYFRELAAMITYIPKFISN